MSRAKRTREEPQKPCCMISEILEEAGIDRERREALFDTFDAAMAADITPLGPLDLRGARGVLINVTGGYDLTLFELDEAANRIRGEVEHLPARLRLKARRLQTGDEDAVLGGVDRAALGEPGRRYCCWADRDSQDAKRHGAKTLHEAPQCVVRAAAAQERRA